MRVPLTGSITNLFNGSKQVSIFGVYKNYHTPTSL